MRKLARLTFLFMLLGLVGCEKQVDVAQTQTGVEQMDANNIVSITTEEDRGAWLVLTDHPLLERFVQVIAAAEYDLAELDIGPPDHKLIVKLIDSASYDFSFWINGENTGIFIKSGQIGHYRLQDASKKALQQWFESAATST